MSFYIAILVYTGITLIAVQGVYLLTGLTGLFSFGQAGFMAIGAYVSAVLSLQLKWPFLFCILGGMAAAALVAAIAGYPTIKLKTNYFALATLGLAEAIRSILNVFVGFTGGATGVGGIPVSTKPWMVLVCVVGAVALVRNFVGSRHGRACIAIRTDETAAQAIGINPFAYRLQVFVMSACLSALAGGLLAFYISYIAPDMFSVGRSVEMIVMVFFGGLRSITGAAVATVTLTTLPEFMHFASEWRGVLYSTLVLAVIIYRPQGLFGDREIGLREVRAFIARRRKARARPKETAL